MPHPAHPLLRGSGFLSSLMEGLLDPLCFVVGGFVGLLHDPLEGGRKSRDHPLHILCYVVGMSTGAG